MNHYNTIQGSFELAATNDGGWCLTLADMEASGEPADNAVLETDEFDALAIEAAFEQAGEAIAAKLAEADTAHDEALAEEVLCGTCGGSGGGPDPETACPACGGSGRSRTRVLRHEDEDAWA